MFNIYDSLVKKETALALVGLGYVGMPIAVAFARKGLNVIGYDLNKEKIALYRAGIDPTIVDPWANPRDAMHEYGVTLTALENIQNADCIIVAVAHNEFKALKLEDIKKMFHPGANDAEKVLIDVKGLFSIADLKESGLTWWRL